MVEHKVIFVTGGSGLVGQALQEIVATEEKRPDETWIFISSKDGDVVSSFKGICPDHLKRKG